MLAGKRNLKQSRESPQDWCFGINQQSTGITSSGFWENIDSTKFLNGSCPPPRLVWPIDVMRKRFPQDTYRTSIQTPKFMKIPLGYTLLGSYRKHWMEKLEARENNQTENLPIMTPSFEKCVSQNIFGYSLRQMRRWKNTRLNLW